MMGLSEPGLAKLSRAAAWIATATVIAFIVTGYGMTKRIIDPDVSKILHVEILPVPLFLSLLVHGGISARAGLRRWRVFENGRSADLYVGAVSLVLLGLFVWMYLR